MENKIYTSANKVKRIEDFINEGNSDIFDKENWVKKDLRKIAEVTYSYDTKS
jgi:hypothetical protein